MKTTILKSAFLIALSVGVFSSCVKDDDYSTPQLEACGGTTLVKNREVSQIAANEIVAQHENITPGVSDVIEAYVTSSDLGGNFFKSISFQTKDGSKAFSIPVDATNTFVDYEPGRKVLIKMDGLYTDSPIASGPIGMRIGSLYVSSAGAPSVGRMTEPDFRAAVQPSCTVEKEDNLLPTATLTIGELTSTDAYLNRLIELKDVMFDDSSIESPAYYNSANDTGGATNLYLVDYKGGSLIFRTSSYANFATKKVLRGKGTVRGVLTKYGTDYQFVARTQSDIKLSDDTASRFLFKKEGFDNGIGTFSQFSVVGPNQVWNWSATFGNPDGMMKMSGYASGNQNNEDWLISPSYDLSTLTAAYFNFDNAYKFTGDPIQVLISKNYTGTGSPTAAGVIWTPLTGYQLSSGNYVYAKSGAVDISAFTGVGGQNVHVAIKYTSNTSSGSTWEIDNLTVSGK